MHEAQTRLLRHVIDCDGHLPKECAARVFLGSSITEAYFHEYDPKENRFTDTYHSFLFDLALDHFSVYGAAPSEEALLMQVEGHIDALQKKEVYALLADVRRYPARHSDTAFLIDEVRKVYMEDRHTYMMQKSLKIRADHGIEEALKYLTSNTAVLNSAGITGKADTALSASQFADTVLERMKSEDNLVPVKARYALPCFNNYTGGMFGGDLIMYGAGLSVGKSWLLHEDAIVNAIAFKKKVVIWNLEMREDQVGKRIIARQTRITQNRLAKGFKNWTDEERELYIKAQEGIRSLGNNLLFINARCQNIKQVEAEMIQHFGTTEIDLLMCDYIDKVYPSSGKQTETHDRMFRVSQEAKHFAVQNNLVFLTATQNNRKGNKNPDADITELSYIQFAKDADTIIMITEDPDNPYQAPQPGDDSPGTPGILNAKFVRGRSHAKQFSEPHRLSFEPSTGTIAEASSFSRTDVGAAFRTESSKTKPNGEKPQRRMRPQRRSTMTHDGDLDEDLAA